MIVKMKFINISGPRDDIDRVTDLYLSRYEIQLESALSELKTVDNLRPFVEINPYRDVLNKAVQFVGYLPNADDVTPDTSLGLDDMFEVVRRANDDYQSLQEKKEKLKKKIEELRSKQLVIAPFRPLDCDLHKVLHYRYITYRFGRIAVEFYHKMQKYLMDDLGAMRAMFTGLISCLRQRRRKWTRSSVRSILNGSSSRMSSTGLRRTRISLWTGRSQGSILRSKISINRPVRCSPTARPS